MRFEIKYPYKNSEAFLMFLGPCNVNVLFFKYNQQDATLYNILYYCQCCTRFRRFLRPSSEAQNCTHSIGYMSSLLAATATYTRCCVYSSDLLMLGGETAWNVYSIDSNKEYCIKLHWLYLNNKCYLLYRTTCFDLSQTILMFTTCL